MLAFPKQQRLLRRIEFSRTMDEGVKVVTPHMVLIARLTGDGRTRAGFIVSKKVGGAVERNRVKRRFRELFRKQADKPHGLDLVIIARGPALPASYEDLERSMSDGLRRLQSMLEREGKSKQSQRSRSGAVLPHNNESSREAVHSRIRPSQPPTADL